MEFKNITYSVANKIAAVTINRPDKLNALNTETLGEIQRALDDIYLNKEVMGAIFTGAGEKAFAAGADIKEFLGISVEDGKALAGNGHHIFNMIEQSPKPIIAAVNGYALGGGCELAMSCHMRIAADGARFGQPEVNLGLIPGYGGTQRLIQLIGKTKATELLMTADMIAADEALNLGLVNYVTSLDQLIPKCEEILQKIFTKSPVAIRSIIKCVNAYYTSGINGLEYEIDEFGKCFGTDDFKEGTTAFIEKRKPAFSGS